ncbi:MAG: DUF4143 domain-containing protein [Pseudonocardiaceae bacterium]|nr:DUF4143 domain-containing protein [Pseudonocardiaceae bacterium]
MLRDPDLLGRLLDSFVTAQIRAELVVSDFGPRLFHLRQADGRREVDLVVEFADGRLVAIEVKAAAAPDTAEPRHLVWLRDQLGPRMVAGLVLHGGPHAYPLAERVYAAPICSLWTA